MNAVDTNVLIYSIDARDPRKQQIALGLLTSLPEAETIVPWQVACEVAAVLRVMRDAGRFTGDYAEAVAALRTCFPVHVPTVPTLERSLRLQTTLQVSVWDALLIAACAEAGVKTLYTEDLQSQPVIDGISIINPFA